MTSDTALGVSGLGFAYGGRPALSDIDLSVARGERLAILGPSGSGKSTLLRLIAGLERPAGGWIEIDGHRVADDRAMIPPERRRIGLVFQEDALFPHMTLLENVAFGLRGMARGERQARALEMLGRLGLGDRANDWPHRLSGGEQQRVAVARALAPRPSLILMDEPFSRLDSGLRRRLRDDVFSVLRSEGVGVVLVTHDAEEAMSSADRLMLMAGGRILQTASPEDCYLRPVSVEAGRLLGPLNVVPVTVAEGHARTIFGLLAMPAKAAGAALLAFRPEAMVATPGGLEARVLSRSFCGASTRLEVAIDDIRLELQHHGSENIGGDTIYVGLAADAGVLLPAD